MQVLYQRCAAVDVGKDVIAVAVRLPGDGPDGRETVKRTFKTFYGVLREAARWLTSLGVTHVAMEATGIYSMPVYHALIEHGDFTQVLVCNAGHVKNVPGRKTDLADADWLVHLLECGLLAGSFIPPAEIKAARDVFRYRTKVAQQRVSEIARLGNVLQDAGIKIDSVASSIATKSGRAMIEALIDGERRGPVLAELAKGKMRVEDPGPVDGPGRPVRGPPRPDVPPAPGPHRPPGGDDRPAGRPDRGDDGPLSRPAGPADHRPRDRPAGRRRGDLRDRRRPREFFPTAAHLASWTGLCPGNHESAGKRRSGQAPPRQRAPAVPPGRVRLVRGPPRRLPQIPLPPARHEMGRLPQPDRQEESHRRGRPRHDRHHLAHPGHRKALPRARRRLLHQPAWTPNAKPAASSPSSKPSATPSPSHQPPPDPAAPRTRLR